MLPPSLSIALILLVLLSLSSFSSASLGLRVRVQVQSDADSQSHRPTRRSAHSRFPSNAAPRISSSSSASSPAEVFSSLSSDSAPVAGVQVSSSADLPPAPPKWRYRHFCDKKSNCRDVLVFQRDGDDNNDSDQSESNWRKPDDLERSFQLGVTIRAISDGEPEIEPQPGNAWFPLACDGMMCMNTCCRQTCEWGQLPIGHTGNGVKSQDSCSLHGRLLASLRKNLPPEPPGWSYALAWIGAASARIVLSDDSDVLFFPRYFTPFNPNFLAPESWIRVQTKGPPTLLPEPGKFWLAIACDGKDCMQQCCKSICDWIMMPSNQVENAKRSGGMTAAECPAKPRSALVSWNQPRADTNSAAAPQPSFYANLWQKK